MSDLLYRTATDLAGAIRRREASAVEVVEAHLDRIDRVNGEINAVVTQCGEKALERAEAADTALARGEPWGPLHGVPITVKDAFDTAGIKTTSGHASLADNVPSWNATPVARLLAAGAILLGKTNMPPFGLNYQCENDLFGRTNNPWDLTRTPGGSSGGSCAAVAAGMVPLELGGDFAGSIRVPAHYSGVFAIKPTEFLASGAGRAKGVPPPPRAVRHMSQPGPVARSAEDIALALRLIAGPDGLSREVPPVELVEPAVRRLTSYKVGVAPAIPGARPSHDVTASMMSLAEGLAGIGCDVREALPVGWTFTPLMETWAELGYAELGSGMDDDAREEFRAELRIAPDSDDALLRGAHRGLDADNRAFAATLARRDVFAAALDDLLDEVDVLLMPTAMTTAIPHLPTGEPISVDGRDETYWTVGLGYTTPCNLTGHPAVAVPVGLSPDGLPIGVQAVGRRWGDMELLGFATRLTEFVGPIGRAKCANRGITGGKQAS